MKLFFSTILASSGVFSLAQASSNEFRAIEVVSSAKNITGSDTWSVTLTLEGPNAKNIVSCASGFGRMAFPTPFDSCQVVSNSNNRIGVKLQKTFPDLLTVNDVRVAEGTELVDALRVTLFDKDGKSAYTPWIHQNILLISKDRRYLLKTQSRNDYGWYRPENLQPGDLVQMSRSFEGEIPPDAYTAVKGAFVFSWFSDDGKKRWDISSGFDLSNRSYTGIVEDAKLTHNSVSILVRIPQPPEGVKNFTVSYPPLLFASTLQWLPPPSQPVSDHLGTQK